MFELIFTYKSANFHKLAEFFSQNQAIFIHKPRSADTRKEEESYQQS